MSPASVLLIVVILGANAFFVAFEFALVASRRARLEQMAATSARARVALEATRRLSQHIAGVQLGVTVASLGLGAAGEPVIGHALERLAGHVLPHRVAGVVGFIAALLIVVFLHVVVGEIVPKRIVLTSAERALVLLATPMRAFVTIFGPLITVLDRIAGVVLKIVGVPKLDELSAIGSPEELARLFDISGKHGFIEEPQLRLLAGAIEFRDRPASEVMVARQHVDAVPTTTTVAQLEQLFVRTGRSRVPVYERDADDLRGFVHAKDLISVPGAGRELPVPRQLIRRLLLVRETRPLGDVLFAMQRSRVHLAAVLDRDGRTLGIISLEDVLEALVGEIADETDRPDDGGGPAARPGRSRRAG